jgi:lysophospholipase L1-like esterase
VEIIGDSHLKGSAIKINQYLNTKFKVCSLTKPGAGTSQLVGSQEKVLKDLGKSDVIVINGGTNDIDKVNVKDNAILNTMVHFIQKYSNTNI